MAHTVILPYTRGMVNSPVYSPKSFPTSFSKNCWIVLGFVVAVILWGAVVRATGSGAGCGAHWPLCNGEMIPGLARYQTLIEWIHRATSGLSLVAVLGLGWKAFQVFPPGAIQRRYAVAAMVGIVMEALIGAALVLLRLVEHDQSLDRAISIALHLTNTCFLVGALALLAEGAAWPKPSARRRQGGWVLAGFVVLAAAGAWTALGDTLFAVSSFQEGWVRDWARDAHFLERLRILHPILAVSWVAGVVPWLLSIPKLQGRQAPQIAIGLILFNLVLGGANVIFAAPLALQILHLAVANALWVSLVLSWVRGA